MSQADLSPKRRIFFQVATILLVIVAVLQSWVFSRKSALPTPQHLSEDGQPQTTSLGEISYEERIFSLHTKMLIGLVSFLREEGTQLLHGREGVAELETMLRTAFQNAHYRPHGNGGKAAAPRDLSPEELRLLQKKLIAASYFNLPEMETELCSRLEGIAAGASSAGPADRTWILLCQEGVRRDVARYRFDGDGQAIEQPIAAADPALGWFGDLLHYLTLPPGTADQEEARQSTLVPLQKSAIRMFAAIGFVVILLVVGVVILLAFFLIAAGGRLKFAFTRGDRDADWCLEIFCIYLAGMLAMSPVLAQLKAWNVDFDLFAANCVVISALSLVIFWPVLWRLPYRRVAQLLGLRGAAWRTVSDFFAGISGYLASLPLLLLVLFAYSLLLSNYDINPSEGAHPVVPFLAQTESDRTIWLIFVLAVIAAPIVEEVMFRGALYGWLRARAGAGASILISALVFASVHPQGALGLLPLAFIGAVLALLREWRGSLAAPIVAHACFNAGTLLLVVSTLRT